MFDIRPRPDCSDLHTNPGAQPEAPAERRLPKLAGGTGGYAVQTAALSPVQLKQSEAGATDAGQVQAAAARGVSGGGGALPHFDAVQQAFGRHDVSGLQAHVGGAATEATRSIGADAYTTAGHAAFGSSPDLHTAAHEAAHHIHQQGGVSLYGGVGKAGDEYERNADEVADAVVSGRSAEGLLDPYAASAGVATATAVQKKDEPDAGGQDQKTALNVAGEAALIALRSKWEKNPKIANAESRPVSSFPEWFTKLQGVCMRATKWGDEEEAGRQALKAYATWYMGSKGDVPATLLTFLDYIGGSQASVGTITRKQTEKGVKSTAELGGGLYYSGDKKGQRLPNWCSSSTNSQLQTAIKSYHLKTTLDFDKWLAAMARKRHLDAPVMTKLGGEQAYKAKMEAGDSIAILYKGCQAGGHQMTVMEDKGDSFINISGNWQGGAVALDELNRMKTPPDGFDLKRALPGKKDAKKMAQGGEVANKENLRAIGEGTKYASGVDFGDKVLVYSIQRFGDILEKLREDLLKLSAVKESGDKAGFKKMLQTVYSKYMLLWDWKAGPLQLPKAEKEKVEPEKVEQEAKEEADLQDEQFEYSRGAVCMPEA